MAFLYPKTFVVGFASNQPHSPKSSPICSRPLHHLGHVTSLVTCSNMPVHIV